MLVVDATQGIQAQTLANVYLAIDANLKIIPVINKIDLPAADVAKTSREIINLLGCNENEILKISAKTGAGVREVLDAVVREIPAPKSPELEKYLQNFREKNPIDNNEIRENNSADGDEIFAKTRDELSRNVPLRALIFDSYYDDYRGVILYVRVVDGRLATGENILMMATKTKGIALEIGKLTPKMTPFRELAAGEIGYIVTNLKSTREAKVGDTVTAAKYFAKEK